MDDTSKTEGIALSSLQDVLHLRGRTDHWIPTMNDPSPLRGGEYLVPPEIIVKLFIQQVHFLSQLYYLPLFLVCALLKRVTSTDKRQELKKIVPFFMSVWWESPFMIASFP